MINPTNQPTLEQLEAELAPTLRDFRSASTLYAEREHSLLPAHTIRTAAPTPLMNWRRWTLAATMACALVTTASFRMLRPTPKPAPTPTAETATISDEALLENVASDLSTSVPTPLQTLAPTQSTSTTTTVSQ